MNEVDINYLTKAGHYYLILKLDKSLRDNYSYEQDTYVVDYIINKRKIADFSLNINGVLREDGSDLKDKISVSFDESLFVDGVVPAYRLIFTDKDGQVYNKIELQGDYFVTVEFIDGNYFVEQIKPFKVYEPQTYKNLIIIAIVVVVVLGAVIAIVVTVRINRKRYKKGVQKEQLKRVQKDINGMKDVNSEPQIDNSIQQNNFNNNIQNNVNNNINNDNNNPNNNV